MPANTPVQPYNFMGFYLCDNETESENIPTLLHLPSLQRFHAFFAQVSLQQRSVFRRHWISQFKKRAAQSHNWISRLALRICSHLRMRIGMQVAVEG